jgi:hypothetical protein
MNSLLNDNVSVKTTKSKKKAEEKFTLSSEDAKFNKPNPFETPINKQIINSDNTFKQNYNIMDLKMNNSFYSSEQNHHIQRDIAQEMIYIPNATPLPLDFVERIKLLIKQYDMMLQLLIQNMLITNDPEIKYRCYNMLYSFYVARSRILSLWKFPSFEIQFKFCKV